MDFIKLTHEVLSVDEATSLVTHPSCGAVSLFVGTTRDHFEGRTVLQLAYESYQEMAEKEMRKLCVQAREKWKVKHIALHHRLGMVPVGESSVIVAISSEHRRESLEAVSFLIDRLKAKVPIWKKEVYSDGSSDWKQNKECTWALAEGKVEESRNNNEFFNSNNKRPSEDEHDTGLSHPIKKIKGELPEEYISEEADIKPTVTLQQNPELVQILAPKHELQRRIAAFQQRKREELNMLNVQEFCTLNGDPASQSSCARTSAVVLRSKGSSSHLKLTRVVNEWGPQTVGKDPGSIPLTPAEGNSGSSERSSREVSVEPSLQSLKETLAKKDVCKVENPSEKAHLPTGIEERLHNLETFLRLGHERPVPRDVYARLKAMEDRVLHLEGISPEYFKKNIMTATMKPIKDTEVTGGDISLQELDMKIHSLKMKLKKRQIKQEF